MAEAPQINPATSAKSSKGWAMAVEAMMRRRTTVTTAAKARIGRAYNEISPYKVRGVGPLTEQQLANLTAARRAAINVG